MSTEINWRHNCLTSGPHDGRQEQIWMLPLMQTVSMCMTPVQLQQLVVGRIYNDAMQMVEHGLEPRPSQEWADKVKELAGPRVLPTYQKKIGEIARYYRSLEFKRDLDDAIERNTRNKLNPNYHPLHGHDTLNLLCRIIGVSCSLQASKDVK